MTKTLWLVESLHDGRWWSPAHYAGNLLAATERSEAERSIPGDRRFYRVVRFDRHERAKAKKGTKR